MKHYIIYSRCMYNLIKYIKHFFFNFLYVKNNGRFGNFVSNAM